MSETDDHEIALPAGNMTASVVRRGDVVHRTAGPWTPTIHAFLTHVAGAGVTGLPEPRGLDDHGREIVTFLPGQVPSYPLPPWVWSEEVLDDAADLLARVHQASVTFPTGAAPWQLPAHHPVEVVCLNDVAPYNMVFDDNHRLCGLIDLDTASPGPRVWDLAYLAYRLVPLAVAEDPGSPRLTEHQRQARLDRLCRAYAAAGDQVTVTAAAVRSTCVARLLELADFTAARAGDGAPHLLPHVEIYRTDAAWNRLVLQEDQTSPRP